jgi:hypothetical protein
MRARAIHVLSAPDILRRLWGVLTDVAFFGTIYDVSMHQHLRQRSHALYEIHTIPCSAVQGLRGTQHPLQQLSISAAV